MKYLVLVGDGMADFPLDNHGGKTPLDLAATPAMDAAVRQGLCGQFCPIPEGCAPGSDIGNLSLFGYDPTTTFSGRAPLEAAHQGIALDDDEVAFRCNLVTLRDGVMEDFTAGHISNDEAASLIAVLNECVTDQGVRFYPGVGYRHLAVLKASDADGGDLASVLCTPPHDITSRAYGDYLPSGPGSDRVLALMKGTRDDLARHAVNEARAAAGKSPANSIWLWGQGRSPAMNSYAERFGLTGAVISAVDLVKGIGVCAGLEVINVPGATAYLDTNYEGKVAAALEALGRSDFAYLHVEAPDEAGHEGDVAKKVQAIEDFDRRVVAPCLDFAREHKDCRILIAPDHVTAIATRTHAGGPVPFAICGAGVTADDATAYSERDARATGLTIADGHRLTAHFLSAATIDLSAPAEIA